MRSPQSIRELTEAMRAEKGPPWQLVRETLESNGIKPATCAVVEFADEDTLQYRVMVVTSGDRVLSILLEAGSRGDMARKRADAQVVEWEDASATELEMYREEIRLERTLLKGS